MEKPNPKKTGILKGSVSIIILPSEARVSRSEVKKTLSISVPAVNESEKALKDKKKKIEGRATFFMKVDSLHIFFSDLLKAMV